MYLLKNKRNLAGKKGVPAPGDVIVSSDYRKSYVVDNHGSHRRLDADDHVMAVQRVKQELADLPRRKAEAEAFSKALNERMEAEALAARLKREAEAKRRADEQARIDGLWYNRVRRWLNRAFRAVWPAKATESGIK